MQRWSCASTPIHDPGDQSLLGVLDITGGDNIVGPHGSCDGSAPMCYPAREFATGPADVHLANLAVDGLGDAVEFWISAAQYEHGKHTHPTVDVVRGRGSRFSVEAPEGVRLLIRSRLMSEGELRAFGLIWARGGAAAKETRGTTST